MPGPDFHETSEALRSLAIEEKAKNLTKGTDADVGAVEAALGALTAETREMERMMHDEHMTEANSRDRFARDFTSIEEKHADMVAVLSKTGEAILAGLTPAGVDLWHHASCVQGEAGELFDACKKHAIYGKDVDRENVIEELGDLEFYLQGVRRNLGISREETLQANYDKLSARYEGLRYTDAAAIARADKAGA